MARFTPRRATARTRRAPRAGAAPVGENRNSSASMKAIQRASSRRSLHAVAVGDVWPGQQGRVTNLRRAMPSLDIGREHLAVVVLAAVVVEEEALDADQSVELDPFREVGRLVAIDRAGGQISSTTVDRHLGPHSMESLDVFTQDELDDALARPDVIPVCAGDGAFVVAGDQFVRAADLAHVTIRDTVAAEAGGGTTIIATDGTHVRALQGATIDASDSARISAGDRVFVRARDAADVTATTDSVVEALDAATVTVMARASARVTDTAGCGLCRGRR